MGDSILSFNPNDFAILEKNLIYICIQHESSTINSADSWESFRDTPQTINWVNERRISISSHWVHIKLNFSYDIDGRKIKKALITVKSYSMSHKINRVFLQSKLFEHQFSGFIDLNSIMSLNIRLLKIL